MVRNRGVRLGVVALAASAACLLATTGSAAARVAAGHERTVTCGSLSGVNSDDHTLTFSHCTGPTGGYGTLKAPMHSPVTIHWASGQSTQISFTAHSVRGPRSVCPGQTRVVGQVTQTSIKGFKLLFAGSYCSDSTHHVTLVPHTRIKF